MSKEQIEGIIAEEAKQYNWSLDEALKHLAAIRFSVEEVAGESWFTESQLRQSVGFAHWAM
ncbi:hypothetical protein PP175_28865 (plasmid) [Aneurinibacillus sp. Ricciae_BoGa-3]|uniref:hypothetical protein n=1 Tax=Aneurinibacillus sp. Ricciae_BoGa-3 TaxID=3022697 RepID=UPI002341847A|nr:hypothetical protein [Aneurinibacillus sp. Ricciae_BoGa-3]WCK57203.1 hypothetical protein PP175_28865 [Aneurinibacillus sp. Ricciae_BoGa-3]